MQHTPLLAALEDVDTDLGGASAYEARSAECGVRRTSAGLTHTSISTLRHARSGRCRCCFLSLLWVQHKHTLTHSLYLASRRTRCSSAARVTRATVFVSCCYNERSILDMRPTQHARARRYIFRITPPASGCTPERSISGIRIVEGAVSDQLDGPSTRGLGAGGQPKG